MLEVQFINSGWNTDHGFKSVELIKLDVTDSGQPIAKVSSPYSDSVLTAKFNAGIWVADLD